MFDFLQKQTLRLGFECKELIWKVIPGNTGRMGSEMEKGRNPIEGVSSSKLPLETTGLNFAREL